MKISAFCLTSNSIKNGYPFIESIKSWLQVTDELIVIDGGSTDGTIEAIKAIGDNRIRIISDENTKWEDEWYYSRMGKNFTRGYNACSGDWVIKFDIDYILHEKVKEHVCKGFRTDLRAALKNKKLTIDFNRLNFILIDRYFVKGTKTLGVNKTYCKEIGYDIRYGIDIEGRWGKGGFEPIKFSYEENGLNFGFMIRNKRTSVTPYCTIFNYDFAFNDKDSITKIRQRHHKAEVLQRELNYNRANYHEDKIDYSEEYVYRLFKKDNIDNFSTRNMDMLTLDQHPKIIQERIKNLKPDKLGYNGFGYLETSKYYD